MESGAEWPKALTPAQVAKCEAYLQHASRWFDSYQRLDGILKSKLPKDVFYACLGQEWSMCDNIAAGGLRLSLWLGMATRSQLNLMMTDAELAEWQKLPASITAYRFGYDNNLIGFSYSLKMEVAKNFSTHRRYQQPENHGGKFIATVSIPKRYSVLKLDREEHEIIATRPSDVLRLATLTLGYHHMRAPQCLLKAYNFAKRLRPWPVSLLILICLCWQKELQRIKTNPHRLSSGLNI